MIMLGEKKLVKNKVAWGQLIKEHIIHAKKCKYFSLSKEFWKNSVMNRFVFEKMSYLSQYNDYVQESRKNEVSVLLTG